MPNIHVHLPIYLASTSGFHQSTHLEYRLVCPSTLIASLLSSIDVEKLLTRSSACFNDSLILLVPVPNVHDTQNKLPATNVQLEPIRFGFSVQPVLDTVTDSTHVGRNAKVAIDTILLTLDVGIDELLRCIRAHKSENESLAGLQLNTRLSGKLSQ